MASFRLLVHVGDVVREITLVEAALEDTAPLMADVLLVMIRSTQLNFEAQGRPVRWADLAPSTIAKRLRRMKGPSVKSLKKKAEAYAAAVASIQILRDFGLLLQSVGGGASGPFDTADGFGMSENRVAVIGTNRPGADALQEGYEPRNLPARPYILFQDQDEEDIADLAVAWFTRTGPYAAS